MSAAGTETCSSCEYVSGMKTGATTPHTHTTKILSDIKPPGIKPSGRISVAQLREHMTGPLHELLPKSGIVVTIVENARN